MLHALRQPEITVEERGGILVGLAPETDRNEVRKAIVDLYAIPRDGPKRLNPCGAAFIRVSKIISPSI